MQKLNAQEQKSILLLADFEGEYFEDLSLEKYSKSQLSKVIQDNGSIAYSDLPTISVVHQYKIQVLKAPKNETAFAICDSESKTIKLFRGRYEREKKITLLHEMIHAYEYELAKYSRYRDFLMIELYRKLSTRLGKKKMNRIVSFEAHPCLYLGDHNFLFVLKSLELDLRLHKKLGTVFNYGRRKYYHELND